MIRQIIGQAAVAPILTSLNRVEREQLDFAHYTSATTAKTIIEGKSIILRNVRMMNDYSEVISGLKSIELAFGESDEISGKFWQKARKYHLNIKDVFYEKFYTRARSIADETYIACFSEFDCSPCYGKLSMWRAYGFPNGVALVIDRKAFLSERSTIDITTYPVSYTKHGTIISPQLGEIIRNLTTIVDSFHSYTVEEISDNLVDTMLHFAVSTKDFNFSEEREWRAVYRKGVYDEANTSIKYSNFEPLIIGGQPQIVRKLSLGDHAPIRMTEILKKVVIGPTEHAQMSCQAFIEILKNNGYPNPEGKVEIANIPFRG